MTSCSDCHRSMASSLTSALPCGRERLSGVADQLLQLSLCRQKMIDAVQAGRAEPAAIIGRVVFRIGCSLQTAVVDR